MSLTCLNSEKPMYLPFYSVFIGFCLSIWSCPTLAQQKVNAEQLIKKEVFESRAGKDLSVTVDLLSDKENKPRWYAAHIATGVCSDSLCKPIDLTVYWDLLGTFAAYETPESSPLTKFDHIEFTPQDHQKLQQILADKGSILKDYEAEDMVDRSVKVYSKTMDAVTGATSKTFQDVIVPGAVYTVHTLWHIVNGEVSENIWKHTRAMLNDQLIRQMLGSDNSAYKEFVFNQLPQSELNRFKPEIIRLIGDKDPYVPHFAMEKLASAVWADPADQVAILHYFKGSSLEIQNTMLNKFADKKMSLAGLRMLIDVGSGLSKAQMQKISAIFDHNNAVVTEELKKELLVLKK